MADQAVPQRGVFTVCFTEKNAVLSQCHVTPQIKYCDFLVVLHDLTKPFAHNIPDLPISKEPGEGLSLKDGDWRYRILRPAPPQPQHPRDREWNQTKNAPIKGDWQILNCGVGFDLMVAKLTLGPKSVGSWIEVQHQWQEHRDDKSATASELKFKGPLVVDGSKAPPEAQISARALEHQELNQNLNQIQISRFGTTIAEDPGTAVLDLIQGNQPVETIDEQGSSLPASAEAAGSSLLEHQEKSTAASVDRQTGIDTNPPGYVGFYTRKVTSGQTDLIGQIENNTAKRLRLAKGPKPGYFQPPRQRQNRNSHRANFAQPRQAQAPRVNGHQPSQILNSSGEFGNESARPELTMVPQQHYVPFESQFHAIDTLPRNFINGFEHVQPRYYSYRQPSSNSNPYSDDPPIDPALLQVDAMRQTVGMNQNTSIGASAMFSMCQAGHHGPGQSQQIRDLDVNTTVQQQSHFIHDFCPSSLDPALEANHKRNRLPSMPFPPRGGYDNRHQVSAAAYEFNKLSYGPVSSMANHSEAYRLAPGSEATFQNQPWPTPAKPKLKVEGKHSSSGRVKSSRAAGSTDTKDEMKKLPTTSNKVQQAQASKGNKTQSKKKNKKLKQKKKATDGDAEQASEKEKLQDNHNAARDQRAARRESMKTEL